MSLHSNPVPNVGVFNSSYWNVDSSTSAPNEDWITANFLKYPFAQGVQNFIGLVNNGATTLNTVITTAMMKSPTPPTEPMGVILNTIFEGMGTSSTQLFSDGKGGLNVVSSATDLSGVVTSVGGGINLQTGGILNFLGGGGGYIQFADNTQQSTAAIPYTIPKPTVYTSTQLVTLTTSGFYMITVLGGGGLGGAGASTTSAGAGGGGGAFTVYGYFSAGTAFKVWVNNTAGQYASLTLYYPSGGGLFGNYLYGSANNGANASGTSGGKGGTVVANGLPSYNGGAGGNGATGGVPSVPGFNPLYFGIINGGVNCKYGMGGNGVLPATTGCVMFVPVLQY